MITDRKRTRNDARRQRVFEADRIPFTRLGVCRYNPLHWVHEDDPWHEAHEMPFSSAWYWWLFLNLNDDWNLGVSCPACNLKHGNEPMGVIQSLSLHTKLWLAGAILFGTIVGLAFFL